MTTPRARWPTTSAAAAGLTGGDGLVETVRRAAADRDVYLILDQAEEYFLYHPQTGAFERELAELVTAPLRVDVLLSIREDALAKLDRFKALIPNILGNYLRLDRLDRRAGERAIVGPLERLPSLGGPKRDDRAAARRTSARRGRRRPHHRQSVPSRSRRPPTGRRGSRRRSSSS